MKKLLFLSIASGLLAASCSNPAKPTGNATLTITGEGLSNVGSAWAYEGWILVNGTPRSTGIFSVNDAGVLSKSMFSVDKDNLAAATAFIVTIEPCPDPDPLPSATHIMAGDFSGSSAMLGVSHSAALGTDFGTVSGKYILATPADGENTNELSGIWWLDGSGPAAGLTLPTLPAGWKYEGWVVINSIPVSTGRFTLATAADESHIYSGMGATPPFPGEDFLANAPAGLNFPTNLSGGKAVISVEPDPDNSPLPFTIKPLAADIPSPAMDHTTYVLSHPMDHLPGGMASR